MVLLELHLLKLKWLFVSLSSCPGSMQFPYNPLTMRMLSSTPPNSMACPSPSMQSQQQPQGGPVAPTRSWEREPPLLSEQYETLSDSDDWGRWPASLSYTSVHASLLFTIALLSLSLWIPLTATREWDSAGEEVVRLVLISAHWWSERALLRATHFQDWTDALIFGPFGDKNWTKSWKKIRDVESQKD